MGCKETKSHHTQKEENNSFIQPFDIHTHPDTTQSHGPNGKSEILNRKKLLKIKTLMCVCVCVWFMLHMQVKHIQNELS